ncbi:unnamed protein product [Rotaria socialis]|nr:unnamed protein product [Rotaria socialis]
MLTNNSQWFCRVGDCSASVYFYQAFLLNVSVAGNYYIESSSKIDTFGYVYNNSFTSLAPSQNLLAYDNDDAGNLQFRLYISLHTDATYILIVTTYSQMVTGPFFIIATGPASVTFSPVNSSDTTSLVTSNYSSILDTGNDQFCRVDNCSTPSFYYQAFGLNVSIAGTYSFQSISNIDTFGYMYNTRFLYSTPSPNIIASNNDGAGNLQFRLYLLLDTTTPYVLVVTTANPNVTGPFLIFATGLASVTFTSINMSVIPNIPANAKWTQNGVTIAGGHGVGDNTNQLYAPFGLFIDNDQTVVIADALNHRIMQWKNSNTTSGQVVAGGNGQGNELNQLNAPSDVLIDKKTDSLIICDWSNQRVVRWPRRSRTTQGEILIDNIDCYGLAMDEQRYLYVSDWIKDEVRRYQVGENNGTAVAGGNGQGDGLNQMGAPKYLFVDRQQNVYVSDNGNHRVMKWNKGAKEGIVVAGGQGQGNALTQFNYPEGIVVDTLGTLYVADSENHRVMRWTQGDKKQGTVTVGGNGQGAGANQLNFVRSLSFDRHGNLYVVDRDNERVQRFSIE